ncbi:Transmembrane domain-containing protein [Spironucleus salmonicida]|uniref:Transmembrane domain-containing protein n=1 Tax=Spironucleus salmonicida TaxID=348837 RepID=A0A9P8M014_9EUKA|nr:Transmembrane domain-containing protein [Spironucleus salmonicida]
MESPRCQLLPVPNIKKPLLIFTGILNCIVPGMGLLVAACIENQQNFMQLFSLALMQFFLIMLFLVGYVWGIANGVKMILASCKKERKSDVEEVAKEPEFKGKAKRV